MNFFAGTAAGVRRIQDGDPRSNAGAQDWPGILFPYLFCSFMSFLAGDNILASWSSLCCKKCGVSRYLGVKWAINHNVFIRQMDWFNGVKRQRCKAVTEIEYIVALEIGVTKNMITSVFILSIVLLSSKYKYPLHFILCYLAQSILYFTLLLRTLTTI